MAFRLIKADQAILDSVVLSISPPDPVDGWPNATGGGYPGAGAAAIAKSIAAPGGLAVAQARAVGGMPPATTTNSKPQAIPIQFPPRVKGNSKAMNWIVEDTESYEPIAKLQGAKETKLELELKYVVTGGAWDIDKISSTVRTIKGYFYRTIAAGQKGSAPILEMKLYEIAPESGKKSAWRINSCNISHTPELIKIDDKIFPQVTTVSLDLSMITQIANKDGKNPKQKGYANVPLKPKKEWY